MGINPYKYFITLWLFNIAMVQMAIYSWFTPL